jgi:hypothetical protein
MRERGSGAAGDVAGQAKRLTDTENRFVTPRGRCEEAQDSVLKPARGSAGW